MLKPVAGREFEAWHVQQEGQNFFVGVSRGVFRGQPAEICTVVVNLSPNELATKLLASLRARKVHSESEGLQVTEVYELQGAVREQAFLTFLKTVDGRPPVNVTFIGLR
jgi:hypothetical protein